MYHSIMPMQCADNFLRLYVPDTYYLVTGASGHAVTVYLADIKYPSVRLLYKFAAYIAY